MKLVHLALLPLIFTLGSASADAQQSTPAKPQPSPQAKPQPARQRPRAAAPAASTTASVTVTEESGKPIPEVRVVAIGPLDRSGSTGTDGRVRFEGLRAGTYRLRFTHDGYTTFERQIEWRAGQPAVDISVTLTPAPAAPEAPAAPAPRPSGVELPPPGEPRTLSIPDFIEKNFITNKEPSKESQVGCSGLAEGLVWQVMQPLSGRQHASADLFIYVVGGEGTIRLAGRDTPLEAGSFAVVPRGTAYDLARRGRNPLIALAVLAGAPCR